MSEPGHSSEDELIEQLDESDKRLLRSLTTQAASLLGASAGPETPQSAVKWAAKTHVPASESLKSVAVSIVEDVHDAVQSGRDMRQRTLDQFRTEVTAEEGSA